MDRERAIAMTLACLLAGPFAWLVFGLDWTTSLIVAMALLVVLLTARGAQAVTPREVLPTTAPASASPSEPCPLTPGSATFPAEIRGAPVAIPSPSPDDDLYARAREPRPDERQPELDDYEITEFVGRGGQATVWKATSRADGRTVAIKYYYRINSDNSDERKRVVREVQSLRSVKHANVVTLLAFLDDKRGSPCLVMEHLSKSLDGEGLPLDPSRAARLVGQVARGLEALHTNKILHRDVKPGNVLLTDDGQTARLADLGIALDTTTGEHLTLTGERLGTPAYSAPETDPEGQARPVFTDKSDVFSLGLTLHVVLGGRADLKASPENTPRWLDAIRVKCLLPEASRPDAKWVAQQLEAFVADPERVPAWVPATREEERQKRQRAEQEREEARLKAERAEQERARAEQETEGARRAKERAEQDRARAEQEREEARREKERAERALHEEKEAHRIRAERPRGDVPLESGGRISPDQVFRGDSDLEFLGIDRYGAANFRSARACDKFKREPGRGPGRPTSDENCWICGQTSDRHPH